MHVEKNTNVFVAMAVEQPKPNGKRLAILSNGGSDMQPYFMIKSVEKVFRLIETLSKKRYAGISDLANALNMTKTNVHRLLLTLRELGYVRMDSDGRRYFLSHKLFSIGCSVPERQAIVEQAYARMEDLARVTHETINLAIFRDDKALYLEKISSPEYLKIDTPIGQSDPCYTTALGKVLLAGLSEEELHLYLERHDSLQAYTKNTITDPKKLVKALKKVRKLGYSTDVEEILDGVCCLAVPIRDSQGKTIAAMSISGPKVRMTKQKMDEIKAYLLQM